MFPSTSKTGASRRGPGEPPDEQYSQPLFDPPFSTPQPQVNYGSRSIVVSSNLPPSSHGSPTPLLSIVPPPPITDEQVSLSRIQTPAAPPIPPHTPSTPQYTSRFFPDLSQGSPPIARLRPASWSSSSLVDEEFDDYRPTRSKSTADFRRDSGDDQENPSFGTSTLQPLSTHDPWGPGVFPPINASPIPPREGFIEAGAPPITDSLPVTPFPTDYLNEKYGATVDQPEASTSARRLPSTTPPTSHSGSSPTDSDPTSKPQSTRPRKLRRRAAQGPRQQRDDLPDPAVIDVIDCGWRGCGRRIQYDVRSVKDHVRHLHGGLFRSKVPLTCRWVRNDTGMECGSTLLPESLCRHTLDMY